MTTKDALTVVDLFAGAGGFGLGFQLAGYHVALSLELDEWAAQTLRYNNPEMKIVQADIRHFQSLGEILEVCSLSPDIIIGGPPCQGFSIAGPAQKDPKDPRNSLFKDFARWVETLSPQAFVMENVKGLLTQHTSTGEPVIDIIHKTFVRLGYAVEVWLLNAAEYGVPQVRERIFIVGNRLGLKALGVPPKIRALSNAQANGSQMNLLGQDINLPKAISLLEAISDCPVLEAGEGEEVQPYKKEPQNDYQRLLRGKQSVLYNHVAMEHSARLVERFKHIGWGESSADVPEEHQARRRNGNGALSGVVYDQNNRRLHPHKPSHTIAASFYANFIHPFQHRNLTAREGARVQSFPDHYRFMGKKTTPSHSLLQREGRLAEKHLCQYNQIGNAVPPLLAKAIAEHIKKAIQ
ncbi:MAG: DNA cytosine methyltransferase [Acidobacteria bacterium]|nr:DNA cytosine methyltransferase [Acidobacteriota bacterium]